jgi:hypothetical protein
MTFDLADIIRLIGAMVTDPEDEKVGRVRQVYLDPHGAPSWAAVRTGLFDSSELLLPLRGAVLQGRSVRILFSRADVLRAPRVEALEELSAAHASELRAYYDRGPAAVTSTAAAFGPGSALL